MITLHQFVNAVGCTQMTGIGWHEFFIEAMKKFNIETKFHQAAFLANVGHESGSLSRFVEDLNYSAQRLTEVWPKRFPTLASAHHYAHAPERLANQVYANRNGNKAYESGDGWNYRARGPIQCTFANNYRAAGKALNLPLIEKPHLLLEPRNGAAVSCWFFVTSGCNTEDSFDNICDRINIGRETDKVGDSNGYKDRLRRFDHAMNKVFV